MYKHVNCQHGAIFYFCESIKFKTLAYFNFLTIAIASYNFEKHCYIPVNTSDILHGNYITNYKTIDNLTCLCTCMDSQKLNVINFILKSNAKNAHEIILTLLQKMTGKKYL